MPNHDKDVNSLVHHQIEMDAGHGYNEQERTYNSSRLYEDNPGEGSSGNHEGDENEEYLRRARRWAFVHRPV